MRLQTPAPGPASFTTALLKEMNEMLVRTNRIVTSQLAHRLVHKRVNLKQTPIHDDMSLGHQGRSIRWKSFLETKKVNSQPSDTISQLKLRVAMSVDTENQDRSLHDLVQWLKIEAPSFVREVAIDEVLLQTEQLQQIILATDVSNSNSPSGHTPDKAYTQDIVNAWQDVDSLFTEVSQTWNPTWGLKSPERVPQLKEKILHFIQELELRNSSLLQRLATLPETTFEDIAYSHPTRALEVTGPLRLVRLIKGAESASESLEINATDIQTRDGRPESFHGVDKVMVGTLKHVDVLIEYKPKERRFGEAGKLRDRLKIQKLACILTSEKSSDFRSLKCLHWFDDNYNLSYGLVFQAPASVSLPYATLLELLGLTHRKVRPTLGRRFRIAHEVGCAIKKWHSVGWVHGAICSRNIFIFHSRETLAWEFSKPFLGGFNYSRRESDFSDGHRVEDINSNVCRHPSRQGVPLQRHDALHDIYAYGVLLLEIGLWQSILEHRYFQGFGEEGRTPEPEQIQEMLVKIARQSLGHTMGADYQDAVVICLEDGFRNLWDDYRTRPRFIRTFQTQVLNKVAKGLRLN